MRIGNLTIDGTLFLAPLAGISSYPFRFLARRFGAAMCYTEMVSADAIIRDQRRTLSMLDIKPDEYPVGVQLFGSRPEYMEKAVKRVEQFNPQLIDINIGCPVPKVVRKNGGAALLKNPFLALEVIAATVDSASVPVTIKIRTGWQKNRDVYLEIAQKAEKTGVAAITLHPRARTENYGDKSDWSKIALLKREVSIPVIGNGDIKTPQDAKRMFDETGCDAVMLGRAAMKNPYIFRRIRTYLEKGEIIPDLTARERLDLALEHTRMMIEQFSEKGGVLKMRKHLAWYTKGLSGGAKIRNRMRDINTYADVRALADSYLSYKSVPNNG